LDGFKADIGDFTQSADSVENGGFLKISRNSVLIDCRGFSDADSSVFSFW
jgi:hypothetical protein